MSVTPTSRQDRAQILPVAFMNVRNSGPLSLQPHSRSPRDRPPRPWSLKHPRPSPAGQRPAPASPLLALFPSQMTFFFQTQIKIYCCFSCSPQAELFAVNRARFLTMFGTDCSICQPDKARMREVARTGSPCGREEGSLASCAVLTLCLYFAEVSPSSRVSVSIT